MQRWAERIWGRSDEVADGVKEDKEIWVVGYEFIALWRRTYTAGDESGGRGGGVWRGEGEESDRLDCESTHRRTLFNVSLTFLFPVSDPRSPKETVEREGRQEEVTVLRLHFTQGHKPQTKSGVRVHRRASQSGRRRVGGWACVGGSRFH